MSTPYDIKPNHLTSGAEEFALHLLMDAADVARAVVSNLPDADAQAISQHPIVAMTYALLVHFDRRAEEQCLQGRCIFDALQAIKESVDSLAARRHGDDQTVEPQPTSKQALFDYVWLKELLELAQPRLNDGEYGEAIIRLQRLAGL